MNRPPVSFNLDLEGYGLIRFPVAVEYDYATGQWMSFCDAFDISTPGMSGLEEAVKSTANAVICLLAVYKSHPGVFESHMNHALSDGKVAPAF